MNITVFGAGSSGLAALKKLRHDRLFLTESRDRIDERTLKLLKKLRVPFELGGHTRKAVDSADLIIVSPSVALDIPVLKEAGRKGIPIISEIEMAYRHLKVPVIAVTGTNGKTTTTTLIARMLNKAGIRAKAAGNIGYPLIAVDDSELDCVVAEVSSYQLEAIDRFRPKVSVILNISEDHLARHRTMKEYSKLKAEVFRNQGTNDRLVYNYDDKRVREIARTAKCKKVPFSRRKVIKQGAYVKNGSIYFRKVRIMDINDVCIKGEHNLENSLASVAASMLFGAGRKPVENVLKHFKGVEHRIEFVRDVDGVAYFNDSKGTNPSSTVVAIRALEKVYGIVLILGGRDKMTDLSDMCREIKAHVREVVLLGEAKARFKRDLRNCGYSNLHEAGSFRDAVMMSRKLARRGEAVLLSPACASFDMFRNYEERGKVFKKIVSSL